MALPQTLPIIRFEPDLYLNARSHTNLQDALDARANGYAGDEPMEYASVRLTGSKLTYI